VDTFHSNRHRATHTKRLKEKVDESPAQYQEVHGDIYDGYVDSSDTDID
jgi:hypothetical protein